MTAEEVWLYYFNDLLLKKGMIDEDTRNKMSHLIYKNYHKRSLSLANQSAAFNAKIKF